MFHPRGYLHPRRVGSLESVFRKIPLQPESSGMTASSYSWGREFIILQI